MVAIEACTDACVFAWLQEFLTALNNPNKVAPTGPFALLTPKPPFWERPAFLLWTAAQVHILSTLACVVHPAYDFQRLLPDASGGHASGHPRYAAEGIPALVAMTFSK